MSAAVSTPDDGDPHAATADPIANVTTIKRHRVFPDTTTPTAPPGGGWEGRVTCPTDDPAVSGNVNPDWPQRDHLIWPHLRSEQGFGHAVRFRARVALVVRKR
jgi:hypothetical protein